MLPNGIVSWSTENFAGSGKSAVVSFVNIESTTTAAEATITFFKGNTTATANKMGVALNPVARKSDLIHFGITEGYDGLYLQDGAKAVTSSNVSWASISFRVVP